MKKKQEEFKLNFFGVVSCEKCGRNIPYGKLLGRAPIFYETCNCGEKIKLRNGVRSVIFWLGVLVLCCVWDAFLLERISDILPIFIYTMLIIIAAFFISPFTVECVKKKKNYKKNGGKNSKTHGKIL